MILLSTIPTFIWILLGLLALIASLVVWIKFYFSDGNQRKIIQNKVKKYFGFLFDYGFKIDKTHVNGPNGAWSIVLKSEKCKVRIIQDRSDIFCELMPNWSNDNKYLDLSSIIVGIEKTDEFLYYSQAKRTVDRQLEFYGKVLYSNFDKVVTFLENYSKSFATAYQ